MKNSLACCYLTHDHADILDKVLEHSIKAYSERRIDICIYDDSGNEDTKAVVEKYIEEGFDNIYYIDIHKARNANHKLFLIMNGEGLPKDYDYIWPTKDRQCFEPQFLDRLCEMIDQDPDVIIGINEWQRWDISKPVDKDVYTDPVELYRDYGFYITNWECTIRKRSSMLDKIDWNKYRSLYDIENNPFNQLLSLFVRAAEMESFTAGICRYDQNERFFSASGVSGWRNEIFELWIDKWVAANYKLPAAFDAYKLKVIKDETNLREIFGSAYFMMGYSEDGIYNRGVYEKYEKLWPMITDIPIEWLKFIADKKYEEVISLSVIRFEEAFKNKDYFTARNLFAGNKWFSQIYDDQTYKHLFGLFNEFTYDMLSRGQSEVFADINEVEDIWR